MYIYFTLCHLPLCSDMFQSMYKWISQFLHNMNARVQMGRSYIRKTVLSTGVPKEGVLSSTFLWIFIDDILKDLTRGVHGAIYADDLLWCSQIQIVEIV